MINVGGYIDTDPGTYLDRWFIVNHLLTLSGDHVNDFFGARVVMPRVALSLGEFNHTETEALCTGNSRFAQEVDFSPVKFHTINILRGGNDAGSKSLHTVKVYLFISRKNASDQAILRVKQVQRELHCENFGSLGSRVQVKRETMARSALGQCERRPAEVERLASHLIELSTRHNFLY
jgi:hypothetical protein